MSNETTEQTDAAKTRREVMILALVLVTLAVLAIGFGFFQQHREAQQEERESNQRLEQVLDQQFGN